MAETTSGFDATYFKALVFDQEIGGSRGIDAALQQYNLDALILPGPGGLSVAEGGMTSSIAGRTN